MTAIASPPVAADERAALSNVSWDTYERLLADDADRSVPRLTYDRGLLEIVSSSPEHEEDADALRIIVVLVAAALSIPIRRLGATTFRRPDLAQGFEADGSFYIQHEAQVRGKSRIDLTVDPPPDLVIEMVVTRSHIDKLPMLALFGVPEVWRGDGKRVAILALADRTYQEVEASLSLPGLTSATLTRFVREGRTRSTAEWVGLVTDWAQRQRDGDR